MTYLEAVNRYLDLVRQARVTTLVAATDTVVIAAKWLINEAMSDLIYVHDWPWRRKTDVGQTVAPYSTGTVTATLGSTTVTGSGTTWTSAMVGRKFRVDGDLDFYTVSAFTSTTSITLADAYVNATVSGSAYEIYQDTYALAADMDRIVGLQVQDPDTQVIFASDQELYDHFPNPQSEAAPDTAVVYQQNTSGNWQVQFYPIPSDLIQFQYQYYARLTELSADADDMTTVNLIPLKLHQLVIWRSYLLGLASGMEDDPILSKTVESRYSQKLAQEIGMSKPDKGRWRVMRNVEGSSRRRFVRLPPAYPDIG